MATTIEVLFKTLGGPAAAQTGAKGGGGGMAHVAPKGVLATGGSTPKPPPDTPVMKKMLGGVNKFVKGQLGLRFGVGSLLKQSQIFTSTIGVIFQLLGALVDVMLAPLLPLFMPLLRLLGKAIPIVSRLMEAHITPMVTAIVNWFSTFFGSWTSWGDKLFGEDGLGGLSSKFTAWWTGTATPYFKEKLKEVYTEVGNKLQGMWDWFAGTSTRVKGWIITFFLTQFTRIPKFLAVVGKIIEFVVKLIPKIIGGVLKLGLKLVGYLSKAFTFFIKMMVGPLPGKILTGVRKVFTWVVGKILGLGKSIIVGIGKLLLTVGKFLLKGMLGLGSFILKGVLKLPGLIYKGALNLLGMLVKGAGKLLGKLPFIGGKLEKMMTGVGKLVTAAKSPKALVGGIGKALGGGKLLTAIGGVAKLTKAIPVVGAIATAGFGAYEVGKAVAAGNYAKAGALATKTVAATALTGLGFSAAGLAVDVGGTLAANALFKDAAKNASTSKFMGRTPISTAKQNAVESLYGRNTNVTVELIQQTDGVTTSTSIQQLKAKAGENERFQREFERG